MGDNIGKTVYRKYRTLQFHLQCCSATWTQNIALYRGSSVQCLIPKSSSRDSFIFSKTIVVCCSGQPGEWAEQVRCSAVRLGVTVQRDTQPLHPAAFPHSHRETGHLLTHSCSLSCYSNVSLEPNSNWPYTAIKYVTIFDLCLNISLSNNNCCYFPTFQTVPDSSAMNGWSIHLAGVTSIHCFLHKTVIS